MKRFKVYRRVSSAEPETRNLGQLAILRTDPICAGIAKLSLIFFTYIIKLLKKHNLIQ